MPPMYRAYVHLIPRPSNHPKSQIPGAFPATSTVVAENQASAETQNVDFPREIELTTEKPIAVIGRASRSVTKGLMAAKDNGFFNSQVMSRNHAILELTADPEGKKKIVIRDTTSMHGTFVNGIKLEGGETATLQDGTEVTFGTEIVRVGERHGKSPTRKENSQITYTAKTFRCEVEMESIRTPSPPPAAAALRFCGYGVSGADLLHSDREPDSESENAEDEDETEEYTEDVDRSGTDTDQSSPLGIRSRSPPVVHIPVDARMSSYVRSDDIPESYERTAIGDRNASARTMPSITSLINGSDNDSGLRSDAHSIKVRNFNNGVGLHDVESDDDDCVEQKGSIASQTIYIDDDEYIESEGVSSKKSVALNTIIIDDDEQEDSEDEEEYMPDVDVDVDEMDAASTSDEESEYRGAVPRFNSINSEDSTDSEDDHNMSEDEDSEEDEMVTANDNAAVPSIGEKDNALEDSETKQAQTATEMLFEKTTTQPFDFDQPTSPPDVLSSKKSVPESVSVSPQVGAAPQGMLPSIATYFDQQVFPETKTVTSSGAQHGHWSTTEPANYIDPADSEKTASIKPKICSLMDQKLMDQKRTFFSAREENGKQKKEELTQQKESERPAAYVSEETDSLEAINDIIPTQKPYRYHQAFHDSAACSAAWSEPVTYNAPVVHATLQEPRRFQISDIVDQESAQPQVSMHPPPEAFSKCAILPTAALYCSPPASVGSDGLADELEEGWNTPAQRPKASTPLDADPALPITPPKQTQKRKHGDYAEDEHVVRESSAMVTGIEDFDMSTEMENAVFSTSSAVEERPIISVEEPERPAKRARTSTGAGSGIIKMATAMMFGGVVGAAAMFAGLVATAQ